MFRLETIEAMVDKARLLEADVVAGRRACDEIVREAMLECLFTVDAFLAWLPQDEREAAGKALARRFLRSPAYEATVAPRRRATRPA